jgi:hypothetical protein
MMKPVGVIMTVVLPLSLALAASAEAGWAGRLVPARPYSVGQFLRPVAECTDRD